MENHKSTVFRCARRTIAARTRCSAEPLLQPSVSTTSRTQQNFGLWVSERFWLIIITFSPFFSANFATVIIFCKKQIQDCKWKEGPHDERNEEVLHSVLLGAVYPILSTVGALHLCHFTPLLSRIFPPFGRWKPS